MRLREIAENTGLTLKGNTADPEIKSIEYDSRFAGPGSLFMAIRGLKTDGHRYIQAAIKNGASAILAEEIPNACPVPILLCKESRRAMAKVSRCFYGTSNLPFRLNGVTGTNGKTTVTYLLRYLESLSGERAAALGTLGFKADFSAPESPRTTPESRDLHRLFKACTDHGIDSLSMEVSSIALDLHRVDGIEFNSAIFTNLSRDHLDFHKSMDRYFQSKMNLFSQIHDNGTAVINIDDPYGNQLYLGYNRRKAGCSLSNPTAEYHYKQLDQHPAGVEGEINTPYGLLTVSAPLPGEFNAMNLLQAVAVWQENHPSSDVKFLDLSGFQGVPGRMERITTASHGTIIIDFAHTPDAVDKIISAFQNISRRRLTVVFGCGGDRDRSKRPLMGAAAEKNADRIILTSDNPRSENPDKIIREIQTGLKKPKRAEIIPDRATAIAAALSEADKRDLTLILGKGAETHIETKGRRILYNDKETVINWITQHEIQPN